MLHLIGGIVGLHQDCINVKQCFVHTGDGVYLKLGKLSQNMD